MIDVHFNYQNVETVIQCFLNDKIKERNNQPIFDKNWRKRKRRRFKL